MDVERLQDLVTELREALASAARRNEALAKDNDATSDELRQLKVREEKGAEKNDAKTDRESLRRA